MKDLMLSGALILAGALVVVFAVDTAVMGYRVLSEKARFDLQSVSQNK